MKITDRLLIKGAAIKNFAVRTYVKKKDKVEFYLDSMITEKNGIFLRGWILCKDGRDVKPSILFTSGNNIREIPLELYQRHDVSRSFGVPDELECGFDINIYYRSEFDGRFYLQYEYNGKKRHIVLGALHKDALAEGLTVRKLMEGIPKFAECKNAFSQAPVTIPKEMYENTIDIVVPVYNGFEYLEKLFATIELTDMKYILYIVEDKSPDERVLPFLRKYAEGKKNVVLLENKENLGFVQSVNKAISAGKNHVCIVNTDVELPSKWLERIMLPIITRDGVASSTPFTNSGTICSFPVFCDNNDIFLGETVGNVDKEFSKVKPLYTQMPTGVGFCMGMDRNIINEIGLFDAEVFYKGYGEENDWCQRAMERGYANVMVENLFVYHKHGGSFMPEDKKRYIERNYQLLLEKHPAYGKYVELYCKLDPVRGIREYAKWQLMTQKAEDNIIIFNHNWGGGAITYINDRIKGFLAEKKGVAEIINDVVKGLYISYSFGEYECSFSFESLDEIFDALKGLKCRDIIINELVSFEDTKAVQDLALKLKKNFGARLTMLGHDFYAVCPSYYLFDKNDKHCFYADTETCKACISSNKNVNEYYTGEKSIEYWRSIWYDFLKACDDIVLFSNNTKTYYDNVYKGLNIKVVPHKVDYILPVGEIKKNSHKTVIAVIGNFMKTKGAEIILEMSDIIKKEKLDAEIVVIGQDIENRASKDIKIHGKYKREELPELIRKYEADIVFIASVWPETFSYTTEEAMKMGVRVAAFDIGAPAERLKNYDKSLIIEKIDPRAALYAIMDYVKK